MGRAAGLHQNATSKIVSVREPTRAISSTVAGAGRTPGRDRGGSFRRLRPAAATGASWSRAGASFDVSILNTERTRGARVVRVARASCSPV